MKRREDERLMFLRLDDAEIDGLYSGDGYLDIRKVANKVVATRFPERLGAPDLERQSERVQFRLLVSVGVSFHTIFPSTIVQRTRADRISSGEIVETSRSIKMRSARLPGAMVPIRS